MRLARELYDRPHRSGIEAGVVEKAGDGTDSEGGCSPPEPSSVVLQERIEMSVEVNDGPFGFLLARARARLSG
jgi:hypothetical protein